MRDDGVIGIIEAGPGGHLGSELKPGNSQPEIIGLPAAANAVDAVRYPFQPPIVDQARQRRVAYTRLLCMTPRDQSPLIFCNLGQPLRWTCHTAKYTEIRVFCRAASAANTAELQLAVRVSRKINARRSTR